jgi:hypothetical protein
MSTGRQHSVLVAVLKVQVMEWERSLKGFRTCRASSWDSRHTKRISGGGQDDEAGLSAPCLDMRCILGPGRAYLQMRRLISAGNSLKSGNSVVEAVLQLLHAIV